MQYKTRKSNLKIVIIAVALVAFGTVFLLTGALLTAVYGIKPGDPDYTHYPENTPYMDFLGNACLTKKFLTTDTTVVLDTKGLEESGLPYYDPNYCFNVAKIIPGYIIDKVETYGEDQMKITLVKKP